jgi:Arc/MetJ-type ribon-helix-helix transcriptional regulator
MQKKINMRLSDDDKKRIDYLRRRLGVKSMSEVVRFALTLAVNDAKGSTG